MLAQLTYSVSEIERTYQLKNISLPFPLSTWSFNPFICLFMVLPWLFLLCFPLLKSSFAVKSDSEWSHSGQHYGLPAGSMHAPTDAEKPPEITGRNTSVDQPANKLCFRWQPALLEQQLQSPWGDSSKCTELSACITVWMWLSHFSS